MDARNESTYGRKSRMRHQMRNGIIKIVGLLAINGALAWTVLNSPTPAAAQLPTLCSECYEGRRSYDNPAMVHAWHKWRRFGVRQGAPGLTVTHPSFALGRCTSDYHLCCVPD